jgi:hypothetical protein
LIPQNKWVQNLISQQYRTSTDVFDVVFPNNAIFGASAGSSTVAADGFYILT